MSVSDDKYVFVVESSLGGCGVALGHTTISKTEPLMKWSCIDMDIHDGKYVASSQLSSMSQSLIANQGLTLKDIDYFVVSYGPGTCTGIKVGISLMHGIYMGRHMTYKHHHTDINTHKNKKHKKISTLPMWMGVSGLHMAACHLYHTHHHHEQNHEKNHNKNHTDNIIEDVGVVYYQHARSGFMALSNNHHRHHKRDKKDKNKKNEEKITALTFNQETQSLEMSYSKTHCIYEIADNTSTSRNEKNITSPVNRHSLSRHAAIEASLQGVFGHLLYSDWQDQPPQARYLSIPYAQRAHR